MDWQTITRKAIDAREPRTAYRLAHDMGVSDVSVHYWLKKGAIPDGNNALKLIEIAEETTAKKPVAKRRAGGEILLNLLIRIAAAAVAFVVSVSLVFWGLGKAGDVITNKTKTLTPATQNQAPKPAASAITVYYVKLLHSQS